MDKRFASFLADLTNNAKAGIRHAPESFNALVKLVATDRVMMGSDYCFDMRRITQDQGKQAYPSSFMSISRSQFTVPIIVN
jgi:hypothetical protein